MLHHSSLGQGTVTGIIDSYIQGIESPNLDAYQAVRELAVYCRKEGFGSIANFRQALRIKNYLARVGPNIKEENIEHFTPYPSKLIEAAAQISACQSAQDRERDALRWC